MSGLILPAGMRPTQPPKLEGYSRRQVVALENPEERDPISWMASQSPHTRKVEVVLKKLQLVSILTVDLDSPPVWHARVGFMEAKDDFFVPISMWTDKMEQAARGKLAELTRLPRDVEKFMDGVRPKSRPTNIHVFVPLSRLERDYMEVVSGAGAPRAIRLRHADGVWR